jgi:hypothetical protein
MTAFKKYYYWLPLLLLCLFCMGRAVGFEVHDFANYYFGAHFLAKHQFTSSLYFPYEFNKAIVALGHPPVFAGFAPNTPFLAFIFIPLSMLPLGIAKLVFNGISILLLLYSLKRLVSFYKIDPLYVLLIPVLFLVPIKNSLLFGQVYFVLFFFLSESWLAYQKGQLKKAGVFLSFAILLKVFPLLLLALFLFKKEFRVIFYTLLSGLILVLFTITFCGFDVWLFYIQNVLSKASDGGIASAYVANYQSLFMFLKEMLVFDASQNPNGLFDQPNLFVALLLAFKVGVVAIGFYITKRLPNALFVFSYWILAMILVSPYGSSYIMILLLFPFLAVVTSEIKRSKKIALLVLLFLINNLLLSLFMENAFPFSYLRLFVLVAFFVIFLSIAFEAVNWKIVSICAIIAMVPAFLFNPESEKSSYLLQNDGPLLIHGYKLNNNKLTYFYWNEDGENVKSVPYNSTTAIPVELKQNQVYLNNKQLTFDKSNKRQPMLVDNNLIVYLSDFDRGIGFYTLRKIPLH